MTIWLDKTVFRIIFHCFFFFICAAKSIQERSIVLSDSLLIYVFCTSCQPEIVLPVLQIKTKTILSTRFVQRTDFKFWLIFICKKIPKIQPERAQELPKKNLRHVPTVPIGSAAHVSSAPPDLHVLISRKIQNTSDVRNTSKFRLNTFSSSVFFSSLSPCIANGASKNQIPLFCPD